MPRDLVLLLQHLPDPAIVVDWLGAVHVANQLAVDWLGLSWPAGGCLAQVPCPANDWLARDSVPILQQALVPHWRGTACKLELLGTGGGRWVEARHAGAPLPDSGHWLLTLREIAGTAAQRAARETELRRLHEAVVTRATGIYEHDHESGEIYASLELRAQYGLGARDALTVQSFAGATHPHDAEFLLQEIAQAHDPAGDGSFDVRHRILLPSGEVRWLHTRATTHFQTAREGGRRPSRTLGSCIDITREHENELRIRRLAAILDATPDVVATTELDGRLTYLNAAGRRLLGISPEHSLLDTQVTVLVPEAREAEFERELVPQAIEHGSWAGEFQLARPGRSPMTVALVVLAHQQTRSTGAYLSLIAHDMTQQRELEERLLHAQKLEAIGRLAGGVAHDFNNLLSVIFSFASLVSQNRDVPESARRQTHEILRAGKRAADLTGQLLSFSKKQVLKPRVLCVGHALRTIQPMVRRLLGEAIAVELVLPPGELKIKADPSQFEQVLLNLIVNAKDAMPNGGRLSIRAQHEPERETPGPDATVVPTPSQVWIRISDTGVGMPPEVQARAFEPFFTTKPSGEGTGLGLSTVFGIVTQSGGDVALDSAEGVGTTFHIRVPSTKEPLEPTEVVAPPAVGGAGAVVLVVEDEPQLLSVLVSVLREAGYQPLAASGALEALEIVRRHPGSLDLILTDVVMPKLSGPALSDQLASDGFQIPIVYMSGYTGSAIVDPGVLDAAAGFLAKPFTPDQLLEALGQALQR